MDIKDLEQLIKGRRSIRKWVKKEVPDALLQKVIELGTWAPNGGNYQGWHFIVVKNRATIDKIADEVQKVADKIASWPEAKQFNPEDMARYQKNAAVWRQAPALIGAFGIHYQSVMDKTLVARESFDADAKKILSMKRSAPSSVESVSAAVTQMLLAIHAMGLGAVWLIGPLMAKEEIEKILTVKNMDLICLVALGYPDETPSQTRKPLDQVMTFVR